RGRERRGLTEVNPFHKRMVKGRSCLHSGEKRGWIRHQPTEHASAILAARDGELFNRMPQKDDSHWRDWLQDNMVSVTLAGSANICLHVNVFLSSKEKPTLGGTRIKTRKQNIAAPLDPATFADGVVGIYVDHEGDLELVAKSFESAELDFSRYNDTFFFEVVFTGGHTQLGTIKPEECDRHTFAVLNCEPARQNNLVAKGIVLLFITDFFKEYLVDNSLDDLIGLLKRGKMEDNLLELFPVQKRTTE
ncbi:hypothetical protein KI387_019774, partial [Taxus chinensis]